MSHGIDKKLSDRIDALIRLSDDLLNNVIKGGGAYGGDKVNRENFNEFFAASLSFINLTYGDTHSYYKQFREKVEQGHPSNVEGGRGILKAIRTEINDGWLNKIRNLVSAELFVDFLEMAEHLLKEGYKDSAAVMLGSILEEHLRQLCKKHAIDIVKPDGSPKKADAMNAELAKNGVYNVLMQKSVTSWLGLRNSAAHGKYTEYTKQDVEVMSLGVTTFITQNPL